ncbi:MAG: peptidylprolyl isomerase [Cytophagales bacterium]|nr:peptidylprolyl isomerase [Bernardetiaceae bacterium]MDW8210293.1 peptidylprolyl isomerase [Cytophagales bacterium]
MKPFFICGFIGWISLLQVSLAQSQAMVIDKIIVKVNDYIILKSELEIAYRQAMENAKQGFPPNAKCEILRQLLLNKMLVAKAEIDSVTVSETEINNNLDRRMAYFEQQLGSLQKIEQAYNKTIAQLKEELRPAIQEQLIISKMQNEITKDVEITPRQVKRYYYSIPKDSLPYLPAEVEVGVIVRFPTVSKAEKDKIKARLLDFKRQILTGKATFEELAKMYSEDLASSARGGELGFHGRGELVPPYEAAAMNMEPGEISDPVESEFGFHLIQLIERRGNRYNSRHILIRPEPTEEDIRQAERFLDSLRTVILSGKMPFEKAALTFSDDKSTKTSGGMLQNPENKSTHLAKDELEYSIFMTIDTMKVGSISRPLRFRTDEGKTAVRLIYFKSSIPPHSLSLDLDYQKIHAAALQQEREKAIIKWFEKAKNQLFIDIDPEYSHCKLLEGF